MKYLIKIIISLVVVFAIGLLFVACGKSSKIDEAVSEKVELASATFGEVEFKNNELVKLKQENDRAVISGSVSKMSASQKMEFGLEDVTHVVVLKVIFDEERTIDRFEIRGDKTKVYSTDKDVENYAGSITELLDNDIGEDAFTYLILSVNTKHYELISKYNDQTESVVKLDIEAGLLEDVSE